MATRRQPKRGAKQQSDEKVRIWCLNAPHFDEQVVNDISTASSSSSSAF